MKREARQYVRAHVDQVYFALELIKDMLTSMPSRSEIYAWGKFHRDLVLAWAQKHHLRASDNNVRIPGLPRAIQPYVPKAEVGA